MAEYILATDVPADLPSEVAEKYNICYVPMTFTMDGTIYTHYLDAREMSYKEFYDRLEKGAEVSTSQITYFTYQNTFEPILKEGKDIIYVALTSGLSGTYQGACLAAEDLMEKYPERKIIVVDSLCASIGEGYLVYCAALEKEKGLTIDELHAWILDHRQKVRHWFVVDSLEQLRKGGRISAMTAVIGTALNVKPLLSVDVEGKLVNVGKLRGTRKINDTFCQKIMADGLNTKEQTILLGHAGCPESAEGLKEVLISKGLVKDAMIAGIDPVIGCHVGKGMYAMVYMADKDLEA